MSDLPIGLWPVILLFIALWVYPLWRIIGRTGHHPALSLVAIFPVAGLIVLWWLAFARWPAIEAPETGVASHAGVGPVRHQPNA
jgi:hypothetical protein